MNTSTTPPPPPNARLAPRWMTWLALALAAAAALELAALTPRMLAHWQACRAYPFQLDAEEGFILNQALTLARGGSIYQSIAHPPFLVANYPPLVPWVYSLLTGPRPTPDSLPAGRALAQFAALAAALGLAAIAAWRTRRTLPALLAPLLLLCTYEVYHWAAFVRVDLPALALTVAGLGVFLTVRPRWGLVVAAALFVAAGATRQTAIVAPAACALALLWHDRRRLAWFLIAYAGLGLALLGVLQLRTGGEFWRHVVTYNQNRLDWGGWARVMRNEVWFFYQGWLAALVWGLLAVAGLRKACPGTPAAEEMRIADCGLKNEEENPVIGMRSPASGRFVELPWTRHATGIYLALAALSLLSYAKVGAAPNYVLEPLLAAALWSAETLGRLLDRLAAAERPSMCWAPSRRWGAAVALWGFCLLLAAHAALLHGRTRLNGRPLAWSPVPTPRDSAACQPLVRLLRDAPGDVYSEDPVFTLLAGKAVLHQPFIMAQLAREGRWDERPWAAWMKEKKFAWVVVTEDLRQGAARDYERYTPAMARALTEHYAPEALVGLPGLRKVYYLWKAR